MLTASTALPYFPKFKVPQPESRASAFALQYQILEGSGALNGEVSAPMLHSIWVRARHRCVDVLLLALQLQQLRGWRQGTAHLTLLLA